jgi:hypothetical protein
MENLTGSRMNHHTQWQRSVRYGMLLIFLLLCSTLATTPEGFYSDGRAFYRIESSEATEIVWFESMRDPDNPRQVWSSLLWNRTAASPSDATVSIAFDPCAAWSTQNFWQIDIDRIQFPTNVTPTNVIERLLVLTRDQRTDRDTDRGAIILDAASEFLRGVIHVKVTADLPQSNVVSLATAYGHNLAVDQLHGIPDLYRVRVPVNEELQWTRIYATNSIVLYAEPDGISRLLPLSNEIAEQDAAHIFQKPRAVSENGER